MSIGTNASDKKVVSTGTRVTGLANMVVASINPTMDELKAAGLNPQKEPEYITHEKAEARGGAPAVEFTKCRLDINLYHPGMKFYAKLAIWIEDRVRWNKEGTKVEWINKFGQTAWSANEVALPDASWFRSEGARPAYNGEAKLAMFVKAWANCGPDDQAIFDNILDIIQGDYTELKKLHQNIAKNDVTVLVGVNNVDGKYYQQVYDGFFDRSYKKDYAAWKKALDNEYSKFKADFQNSLELKEYASSMVITQDTPTDLAAQNNSAGGGGQPAYKF